MEVKDVIKTFEMEDDSVTTSKAALSNNTVPADKTKRKVYGILLDNQDANYCQVTLTIEEDTTVQRTFKYSLPAYGEKDVSRPLDAPIFTMDNGQNIKAQITSGSGPAFAQLQAYDL